MSSSKVTLTFKAFCAHIPIFTMTDVYTDSMTRLPSEVHRLNEQFDILTKNMGYIVHPSIQLPSDARIADFGTGTARFLLSLQPEYPNAVMDGYDISSALFPPKDTLPPNITLGELDIKKPFPEHLHGMYDLVHLRLLVAGMLPEDWDPVVRNLSQILKPGGYLQWEEPDFVNGHWQKGRPELSHEATTILSEGFKESMANRPQHGWCDLPDFMRAAGLVSVQTDIVSADRIPETRKAFAHSNMTLMYTWARMMTAKGAEGPAFGENLPRLEKASKEEIESGVWFKYDLYVTYGRKPLE
ncbi:hypothetical protein F5Y16DRAFT_148112 [Xylariaceae sp. FL0255]|nr:hypothetical protein F5Y16DRAFT_148112 [Xylariaceae sp. FL0255]